MLLPLPPLLEPHGLRRTMQALAMLDAVLCPEWEHRYFSFQAAWGAGAQMGSVRNGSGDELFALFDAGGCFIKAFDHEVRPAMAPAAFYAGVPDALQAGVAEPAFDPSHVTFCCWRTWDARAWEVRGDPSGFLPGLDGTPRTYQAFAAEYFEVDVALDDVAAVFAHVPLTSALVARLCAATEMEDAAAAATGIGYPVSIGC